MADSKKYNGSTWQHSLRKLTTATDTLTTLPADIYADGTNATVGLKGNTVQNGTPSPDNPIMPQGCGESTGDLFDKTADYTVGANTYNYTISGLDPNKYYTCSTNFERISGVDTASIYFNGGKSANNGVWRNTPRTFKPDSNGEIIVYIRYSASAGAPPIIDDVMAGTIWVMVNEGSTPIPYGYKIPISSGGVTTNIYLGEVQSTRRVKKQVVTISRIIESETPNMKIAVVALDTSLVSPRTALSTVVPYGNASTPETFYYVNANNIGMVGAVGDTDEQITAKYEGSILYYGIAETTGIVNEPLMKIGNYVDTVSGISIPTITGKDTFDVDTTIKPSEASLSYTGWHDATVEEWDGSQWNE